MTTTSFLFAEGFLILGFILGWFSADRFAEFKEKVRHTYEDLFDKNPHPELFEDGKLNRGEYVSLTFDPGYDPDEYDPEDLIEEG